MFAEGESESEVEAHEAQSPVSLRDRYSPVRTTVKNAIQKGMSKKGAKPSDIRMLREGAFNAAEAERELSMIDTLTGLYNRKGLEDRLNFEAARLKRARIEGKTMKSYIVIADANGLKAINDNQGHAAGDEYLKKIAQAIKRRATDPAARQGGDEFAVILSETDKEGVKIWWERTVQKLQELGVSISAGIALLDDRNISGSMKLADLRSYKSKRQYKTDGQLHLESTGELEELEQLKARDPKVDDRV